MIPARLHPICIRSPTTERRDGAAHRGAVRVRGHRVAADRARGAGDGSERRAAAGAGAGAEGRVYRDCGDAGRGRGCVVD